MTDLFEVYAAPKTFKQRAISHDNLVNEVKEFCKKNNISCYCQDENSCGDELRLINTSAAYQLRHNCDLLINGNMLVEIKTTSHIIDKYDDDTETAHFTMEFASFESMLSMTDVYIIDAKKRMYPLKSFRPYNMVIYKPWADRNDNNNSWAAHCQEYAKQNKLQIVYYSFMPRGSGTPFVTGLVSNYHLRPYYQSLIINI